MASTLDLFRLDGKVALVTGASRGLGAAMALALAEAGAVLALHATTRPPESTARRIADASGGSSASQMLTADLSQAEAGPRLVQQVIDHFGRVDIVVNNAGIIRRQRAADHADALWDEV